MLLVQWVLEFSQTLDPGAPDPRPQTRAQFWCPSNVAWCRNLPQCSGVSLENTSCRSLTLRRFVVFFNNFQPSWHQSNEELFHKTTSVQLCQSLTDFADIYRYSSWRVCNCGLLKVTYFCKIQFMQHAIASVRLSLPIISRISGRDQQSAIVFSSVKVVRVLNLLTKH